MFLWTPTLIESELLHYGYLFVFLGTVFEGDATLITAAFLAHQGYLRFPVVLATAVIATFVANQVYYALAQRNGTKWLPTIESRGGKFSRVIRWSRSHGVILLLASRFIVGFRTLIPMLSAATGMRPLRFLAWNFFGAVLWAGVFGTVGYLGSHALSVLIADFHRHERAVALILAGGIAGLVLWLTHGEELLDLLLLRGALGPRRS